MLALRRDIGIRLTRRSRRARRSFCCNAYWARSFLALSVTRQFVSIPVYLSKNCLSHALSSCRLSINACFWFRVRHIFLTGLPVGVASAADRKSGDLRFKVSMIAGL